MLSEICGFQGTYDFCRVAVSRQSFMCLGNVLEVVEFRSLLTTLK